MEATKNNKRRIMPTKKKKKNPIHQMFRRALCDSKGALQLFLLHYFYIASTASFIYSR